MLWGCLAAHLWVRGREPKKLLKILIWPATLVLLVCLPFTDLFGPFLYRGGFDLIDASSAIVLLTLMTTDWAGKRIFEWKPLVKLGLVAYGFYLWHLTVFYILSRIDHGWNYVVRAVVAFAATLALTLLSWFLLERPLQRWVHRQAPRLPKPQTETTVDTGAASVAGAEDAAPVPTAPDHSARGSLSP